MKKSKNIKNKNLKLSNFVMKLGVVSTVAGTVAASVVMSGNQKNILEVAYRNNESIIQDNKNREAEIINHGSSLLTSNGNEIWDKRVTKNIVSEDVVDTPYKMPPFTYTNPTSHLKYTFPVYPLNFKASGSLANYGDKNGIINYDAFTVSNGVIVFVNDGTGNKQISPSSVGPVTSGSERHFDAGSVPVTFPNKVVFSFGIDPYCVWDNAKPATITVSPDWVDVGNLLSSAKILINPKIQKKIDSLPVDQFTPLSFGENGITNTAIITITSSGANPVTAELKIKMEPDPNDLKKIKYHIEDLLSLKRGGIPIPKTRIQLLINSLKLVSDELNMKNSFRSNDDEELVISKWVKNKIMLNFNSLNLNGMPSIENKKLDITDKTKWPTSHNDENHDYKISYNKPIVDDVRHTLKISFAIDGKTNPSWFQEVLLKGWVGDLPTILPILVEPTHNGENGVLGYKKFSNPTGAKLQVSEDGGNNWIDANENGYSVSEKTGSLSFRWKLDQNYQFDTKKDVSFRELFIGRAFPFSGDLDKNYEDIIESKIDHIFKNSNFNFQDWTVDSFNHDDSNKIKWINISNSLGTINAKLKILVTANDEHKFSYEVVKVEYDNKGSLIPADFYPVITKELTGTKGYITPSDDLSTQQEAQDKVLAKAKKEITDALGKITFDKIHDTAYQALVKNLPATWNPVSEKFSLSHQDYKVEVKKTVDSKNGKIVLKLNVFQPPISRAVASDKIEIQGFLGLDSLLTKQTELEDRIKEIFGKTSGIDKLTTGVFNADLNNVTKKISIKGYAKTHLDLTVLIKATADDKLSYTIDPKVIIKDDNVDVKETLAPTIFSTISNWHNDITVAPKFLSYADIKAKASKQTIEAELAKGLTKFEPSTKISIKINDDYYLDLVLDLSEASSTELRYEVDSFALKYKGNDLPDAQSSPELKSLIGLSEKMNASSTVQGTFPTLVALKDLASKSIDSYVLEKFKYFDFQDWTVDSFNSQPANRTAKIRIYGENDTSAELEISVTADSEKIISYKVTNVVVKEKGVQKIGGPFQSISDDFAAKSGQTQTHDDFRTEKEAQLKAADKAKDDMRIAIDKMTFDKAELPSESKPKVFAGWKGQDKYEAYHQEFDVTYKQDAKDSTGEIIVTSTVAPFTKTGPKKCTPESVTNTIGGFMGITQLTNMQSKVKQAILDEFAKQHLNELTSYFFNKDTKNNVMEVVIDGFGDTTAELTLKLDATADDKLSYTVTDVVVKNGIKVVPDSIAGNAISELKKWTGGVDLNPGFLTEQEYEKNLVIKNFKANPNELASEVINAKNTGVSKAVKGEYEFENDDFRIDYTPDDETGEVLGKVTRKGSSSNVQETISGFLKFKAFADAVKTKDLESKLLSALDKYEDSKTFNFKINDDYALELTVAVLPKDDNTISYNVSGFDVKHNGKSLSNAQNSVILKDLLKIKGDIKVPETNTKLLDVVYEKLHGESRRLDMSQLTKAASIPKPKPTIDLNEVTKELGEFYVSGEQSGSAKLLEENNAPDAAGFEFEFQVIDDEKPLSEPTKTLPINLKNGEHVKITSVLKDGYQVKGKMPEKDVAVKGLKEHEVIGALKLTKATEIKEVPEVAKPASKSNGLMIGLVVAGSVTGLILIGLLALMIAKKRKKRS